MRKKIVAEKALNYVIDLREQVIGKAKQAQ